MKTLFYLVLVFCCVGIAPAEERVMDKTEFDTMVTEGHNHQLKWKGEKYRMSVTTSSKVVGRPQTDHSSKAIIEYGPSIGSRTLTTSMFGDKPPSTRETVRVGNWVYSRSGNDAWTRKEYVASGSTRESPEESPYKLLSSQAEYRYLGPGKLMDKPAQIYVKTERQTKVNQKSGETSETDNKTTYWIDAKGLILKSEFSAEHRGKITHLTSVTMEWELDSSIAITVPEITL